MTLEQWEHNSWLKKHQVDRKEITNLLSIVDRDLKDASANDLSADWRFGIFYNAFLTLCSALLYCEGYRPSKGNLGHYYTLESLGEIFPSRKEDIEYLHSCRSKRNIVEYDYAGGATDSEAWELIKFARELRGEVLEWIKLKHPDSSSLPRCKSANSRY
jgi:hypothetical protein